MNVFDSQWCRYLVSFGREQSCVLPITCFCRSLVKHSTSPLLSPMLSEIPATSLEPQLCVWCVGRNKLSNLSMESVHPITCWFFMGEKNSSALVWSCWSSNLVIFIKDKTYLAHCGTFRSHRSSSSWPPSLCTFSGRPATSPTQWACTAGGSEASTSSCCCCLPPWSWT